jgi:xylitol oxidase
MNRKEFLKSASFAAGGILASPVISCTQKPTTQSETPLTNWAGNLKYGTSNVHYPKTVEEIQSIVKAAKKIKPLGSRHSFNTIADSNEALLSLREFTKVIGLDKERNTVTVEAGVTYGELAPYLHENGYALHNLASLPHITVGGSIATATHGSGVQSQNLSAAVSAIEWVDASGELVRLSREKDGDVFNGVVVALGALGVVTKVTLDVLPSFEMSQVVYRNLPMDALTNHFQAIMSAGYSVSLFTNWINKNISEVWVKSKVEGGKVSPAVPDFFGAEPATLNLHPVEDQSAETVTEQMAVAGPWFERMPHFKMGFKPSTGEELQSEFFVPLDAAVEAMRAVEQLHEKIAPHLFISEIRTIKADDLWMSPCYHRDSVAIHTTWKQEQIVIDELIPMVEEQLKPFQPRPHWAKLFSTDPTVLQRSIERLPDFKALCQKYDPEGKFRNAFLETNLFG